MCVNRSIWEGFWSAPKKWKVLLRFKNNGNGSQEWNDSNMAWCHRGRGHLCNSNMNWPKKSWKTKSIFMSHMLVHSIACQVRPVAISLRILFAHLYKFLFVPIDWYQNNLLILMCLHIVMKVQSLKFNMSRDDLVKFHRLGEFPGFTFPLEQLGK